MVDVRTRPEQKPPDRTTRTAALWATVIAVPVAISVGWVALAQFTPDAAAEPAASSSVPVPVPSTPVQVAAPKLSERAAAVCLAVTSQLPATVRDLPARQVSAGPEQNAAWGEPPLTVSCGVTTPVMCETTGGGGAPGCVPLESDLLVMDRVCWWGRPATGGILFTTLDREVPVQVSVPQAFENPAQWANEFSDVVVETDKSKTAGVPSGCG